MRKRLVLAMTAVALVAVIVLGLPLALLARHQVFGDAQQHLQHEAQSVGASIGERIEDHEVIPPDQIASLVPGRHIEIITRDGQVINAGPPLTERIVSSTATSDGSLIVVTRPADEIDEQMLQVTLLLLGVAAVAVLAAFGMGLVISRRLARPLRHLAVYASTIGEGSRSSDVTPSGIDEIDEISSALAASQSRIDGLLSLQHEFVGDAAHQLRTPLTGIGLRLDEISRTDDSAVRIEAEIALEQVERLSAVITTLLARARGESAPSEVVAVAPLLETTAEQWQPLLGGRTLSVDCPPELRVRAHPDRLATVLGALLDNAVHHGAGAIRLSARLEPAGDFVEVDVADEGKGVSGELAQRLFERQVSGHGGTGIGLALARALIETDAGTLSLSQNVPPRFTVRLPSAR